LRRSRERWRKDKNESWDLVHQLTPVKGKKIKGTGSDIKGVAEKDRDRHLLKRNAKKEEKKTRKEKRKQLKSTREKGGGSSRMS